MSEDEKKQKKKIQNAIYYQNKKNKLKTINDVQTNECKNKIEINDNCDLNIKTKIAEEKDLYVESEKIINSNNIDNIEENNSCDNFLNTLNKLDTKLNIQNRIEYLNFSYMIEKLENAYTKSSIPLRLLAIKWYINENFSNENNVSQIIKLYVIKGIEYIKEQQNNKLNSEVVDINDINYISKNEIINLVNNINKNEYTEKEILFLNIIINCQYGYDMRYLTYIINKEDIIENSPKHYYHKSRNNGFFIFMDYSQNKKTEIKYIFINNHLTNLIDNYIINNKIKQNEYIFPEFVSDNSNKISKFITEVLKKLTNKTINITLLKKIFFDKDYFEKEHEKYN